MLLIKNQKYISNQITRSPRVPATSAAPTSTKTFTTLHINDLHSNLIGLNPASDCSTFTRNNDKTCVVFVRLATLIAQLKAACEDVGSILCIDAVDCSMGTVFAAAIRETGGELQLLVRMDFDATTFGNHDYDLGQDGTAQPIVVAAKAGRLPANAASNTTSERDDSKLDNFKQLAKKATFRRHVVIEHGGLHFGIFELLGKEAMFRPGGVAPAKFTDPIEIVKEMVRILRETKKVNLVIGLHSHTKSHGAIIVNGRTPVVQTGKNSEKLGELVMTIACDKLNVESYKLHLVEDIIPGDKEMANEIEVIEKTVSKVAFASHMLQKNSWVFVPMGELKGNHLMAVCKFSPVPGAKSFDISNLVQEFINKADQYRKNYLAA